MRLGDVLKGIEYKIIKGNGDEEITGVYYDSRKVKPGSLFICIRGFKADGHNYISEALLRGAVAILAEEIREVAADITYILTGNTRSAMAKVASNFYGRPSSFMRVIGVTGTNGKTTTTHLIQNILTQASLKTGILGTLYARVDDYKKEMGHTTPEALEIEEFMSLCRQKEAKYVVMEVSSHALDLDRVKEIDYNVALFTNLTQDHLDYHQNMENYKNAKLKLFSMLGEKENNFAVINNDDRYAGDFIKGTKAEVITYGIENDAQVKGYNLDISARGTSFMVKYKDIDFKVDMQLIGLFSVYNALAAIAFALREGIEPEIIKEALAKTTSVAGRFELVKCGQDFTVVVDYAHTPDGLENVLKTAKELTSQRLITVFGCGGDRDKTKRPLMGEIAARYSDFCIVTSDNPRSEDPKAIIDDIIPGLLKVEGSRYAVVVDRREAIRHAIYMAKPGDMVVIAGKGHETYQLIGDKVLDFDDRKVAAEFLKEIVKR
ncbi:UDP-N-acetylmuramoylalanyl-D-glutamate--2,6-diaminopimelate ligase [Thermosyntropha lipolytica DSM 11003]|uniref:UDP-N-acetylmuramoyl-L-alanyl-D-glutamate--2,6-diaminopimelate ligase n=1 Tax=Thermosyntropha lipolytica DSM 11003 TaxID=1123382 RepID=A0A1M5NYD8_9FIRM|nr:UDP-N-acetylmuramoyl-L-alanyl-D-glutamate--2,6-diaminopimelate ligase [Thermosyntropha lipolytica]SHG94584.1 UDP-N-acetylmuramoylalanyl-D-glutamate--2,6-diaminopimelate ligase [Thermosyntropha lipolytica DSM 11003]